MNRIRNCIDTHHQVEVDATLHVMDQLCAFSPIFASGVINKILTLLDSLSTSPKRKIHLIKIMRHMHHTTDILSFFFFIFFIVLSSFFFSLLYIVWYGDKYGRDSEAEPNKATDVKSNPISSVDPPSHSHSPRCQNSRPSLLSRLSLTLSRQWSSQGYPITGI